MKKQKKKIIFNNKGITLVALVVTIIVLLILAAVSINLVLGDNGIITRAREAKSKSEQSSIEELAGLNSLDSEMEEGLDDSNFNAPLILDKISTDVLVDDTNNPELRKLKMKLNVTSDNLTIELPVYNYSGYTYDFTVDWGDGTIQDYSFNSSLNQKKNERSHVYSRAGEYTISIDGLYESLYVDYSNNSFKKAVVKVEQWGVVGVKDVGFLNCENLIEVAEPTRNSFVNVLSFNTLFCGTNITNIPEYLFVNCPNANYFNSAFGGCPITNISEKIFANCVNATSMSGVFSSCDLLTSIPEKIFANCINVTDFRWAFMESGIVSIPERLFKNNTKVNDFCFTFSTCEGISNIPEKLFFNCENVISMDETFAYCINLESIPQKLFINCMQIESFDKTFYMCENVTGKPIRLWAEGRNGVDENSAGFGCYYNCIKLDNYQQIPEYWRRVDNRPI